jgi:hypothetical protein
MKNPHYHFCKSFSQAQTTIPIHDGKKPSAASSVLENKQYHTGILSEEKKGRRGEKKCKT